VEEGHDFRRTAPNLYLYVAYLSMWWSDTPRKRLYLATAPEASIFPPFPNFIRLSKKLIKREEYHDAHSCRGLPSSSTSNVS
jgi:hypothetical protein